MIGITSTIWITSPIRRFPEMARLIKYCVHRVSENCVHRVSETTSTKARCRNLFGSEGAPFRVCPYNGESISSACPLWEDTQPDWLPDPGADTPLFYAENSVTVVIPAVIISISDHGTTNKPNIIACVRLPTGVIIAIPERYLKQSCLGGE